MTVDPRATQKRQAGEAAAALVTDGMVVGLGTGSTAFFAIARLIERARDGLRITCVPTSERSAAQALDGGLMLVELTQALQIDLTIDGADAVAAGSLDLIKGLGGALLREKIVAAASRRLVIVADDTKLVDRLGGGSVPVPVEVVTFGWQATAARLGALGVRPVLRQQSGGTPFQTDGRNLILDCYTDVLDDPARLDAQIRAVVGVVETGLFLGMASEVYAAAASGVRRVVR